MKHFLLTLLFLVPWLSAQTNPLPTDSIFVIKEAKDFFPLNLASFLLKDKSGTLTIDSVSKPDAKFYPILQEMYPYNQDKDIDFYWIRCTIQNQTHTRLPELLCLQFGLDSLESFIFNPDGTSDYSKTNSVQLTRSRPFFVSQQIAIPLELQPGITKIYLRIANHSLRSREINSIIVSLAEEKSFLNYFLEIRLYQGIVLGMLFLMLILHIFIYLFVRDATYFIFLINLLCTIIYLILRKNIHFEFDFLSPIFNLLTDAHDVFGVLISITAIWFAQAFLNTRQEDLGIHRILNVLMIILGIVAVGMITFQWVGLMNILSIYLGFITASLVIVSSVRSYRRGFRLALYILFGFLCLVFVPIIYIIPLPNYLHFSMEESNFHYLGEALRSLIFAIGIADRFYLMKGQVDRHEIEKVEMALIQEKKMRDEKERISSDLHDNIGSELAILSLELGQLAKEYPTNKKFDYVRQSVYSVNNQLRDTIWAIEKNHLGLEDLENRLNTMLSRHGESHSNIEFNFETSITDSSFSLTPAQGINLIRIIQEAVQNAIKHSGCSSIKINTYKNSTKDKLCVEVSDDGKGFNNDELDLTGDDHYGLRNMKKRAQEMNGLLEIESKEMQGTKIKVLFPVANFK